jgi:hypothetical protein
MAVDEISVRLRARLQEEYGVDEATILMDRPPGGWGDLVTNESLRRELAVLEQRVDLKLEVVRSEVMSEVGSLRSEIGSLRSGLEAKIEREIRVQTWRMITATIACMGSLVGAMGIFVALIKL